MDSARLLAFILDVVPLINAAIDTEGGKLDRGRSNQITSGDILIQHLQVQIITDVLYVNVNCFVPLGKLACALEHFGLKSLVACAQLTEGVHLGEHLCVACQFSLDDSQAQSAGSCHICMYQ